MCDWYREAKKVSRKLNGAPIEKLFKPETMNMKLPEEVIPGHCLACGHELNQREMFLAGRPSLYMCRHCFESLAYGVREYCLWCGRRLPDHQVSMRLSNPRELKFGFCQGECLEYHKVLAGIVLGVTFNTVPNQIMSRPWENGEQEIHFHHPSPRLLGHNQTPHQTDQLADAKHTRRGARYLPFPKKR